MRSLKIINRTHDALFEISWGKCLSKPLNYLNSEIIRARKWNNCKKWGTLSPVHEANIDTGKHTGNHYCMITETRRYVLAFPRSPLDMMLRHSYGSGGVHPGQAGLPCSLQDCTQVEQSRYNQRAIVQLVLFVLIFDASLLQCSAHLILKHLMSSNGAREQDQDYSGDE